VQAHIRVLKRVGTAVLKTRFSERGVESRVLRRACLLVFGGLVNLSWGDGDGDGVFFPLPWVFVSDPGIDIAGEEVPFDKSDCDEAEDEGEDESEGRDSGKKHPPHPNDVIQHPLIPQIITQPIRSEYENIILLDWECGCACVG
jgi:hypothetical protein